MRSRPLFLVVVVAGVLFTSGSGAGASEHEAAYEAPVAPSTTAPSTTAPSTTAPSTTAPSTTAPSTTAPATTAPDPAAADTSKPRVQLVIPTPLTTGLSIRSNEAGRATVRLTAGSTLLAQGTTALPTAGIRRVTLRRTAAGRRALARTGRVTGTLTVKVRDAAGSVTVVRRKVILRR